MGQYGWLVGVLPKLVQAWELLAHPSVKARRGTPLPDQGWSAAQAGAGAGAAGAPVCENAPRHMPLTYHGWWDRVLPKLVRGAGWWPIRIGRRVAPHAPGLFLDARSRVLETGSAMHSGPPLSGHQFSSSSRTVQRPLYCRSECSGRRAQVLADSHSELHPLVDELLGALNVTGARRVRPPASAALSLADLAAGADAVGVSADRLVLPCRAPRFHPRLWRQARHHISPT